MGYSYKTYSDTKDFMKKYVNAEEGAIIYGISKSRKITENHPDKPQTWRVFLNRCIIPCKERG